MEEFRDGDAETLEYLEKNSYGNERSVFFFPHYVNTNCRPRFVLLLLSVQFEKRLSDNYAIAARKRDLSEKKPTGKPRKSPARRGACILIYIPASNVCLQRHYVKLPRDVSTAVSWGGAGRNLPTAALRRGETIMIYDWMCGPRFL